jgi:hypothetical protein
MAKKKRPLASREKSSRNDHDEVGPGKPPRRTQFKKGQSGNPRGRPKGSRNIDKLIMDAAQRRVTANIDGKARRISMAQASAWQLATRAAGGDPKFVGQFLDRMAEIEARKTAEPSEYPLSDADLEVIRTVFDRLQQRDRERGD